MKRAFVVVAFLFAIIDIGAAAPPALNTQGGAAIGAFLKTAIDRGDVPGVVVLVTGPDRRALSRGVRQDEHRQGSRDEEGHHLQHRVDDEGGDLGRRDDARRRGKAWPR